MPKKYVPVEDDSRKKPGYGKEGREKVKQMLSEARRVGVSTKKKQKDEEVADKVIDVDDDEYEEDSEAEDESEYEVSSEEEEPVKPRKQLKIKIPKQPKAPKEPKEPRLTKKDMEELLNQKFKAELEAQMKSLSETLKFNTIKHDHKQAVNMCRF